MRILPLPNFAFQSVIEFGYNFIVDKLTANDLDQIGEYIYKPIGFKYEKVIYSVQKLARKLIADPGDKMVNLLKFENYIVPLDVALGGYFVICFPFISYARLVDRYVKDEGLISNPEIVVPKRIYQLVNNNDKSDEFSIRMAILKIAKELNHPALDDNYQNRVWSIIKNGSQYDALCTSVGYVLKHSNKLGFSPSDGTIIRQYWWRAILGHFGIDDDQFESHKATVGKIIRLMDTQFLKIYRQKSYTNNSTFRDRVNSATEGVFRFKMNPPAFPNKTKFRTYKATNLEEQFRIEIRKTATVPTIPIKSQSLEVLPLRKFTNEEINFIMNFRVGHELDRYVKWFKPEYDLYNSHLWASNFMYYLLNSDDDGIVKYRPLIKIIAQERSFEDLINCNIMYPKLIFGYEHLLDENRVRHVFDLLNLDIPYKSTFTREQRLRILVELNTSESLKRRIPYLNHSIRCSWLPIMGELLMLETETPEPELINILCNRFDWKKFAKSKTGIKLVKNNGNNNKLMNRLRAIIEHYETYKRSKIPIEFKGLLY